jgi:hypothetical protein
MTCADQLLSNQDKEMAALLSPYLGGLFFLFWDGQLVLTNSYSWLATL